MVNCRKCKKSDPLNLVCFDQKCGLQQNLNLICCTCHSHLIHHTISINMFLDIAFIATQSWIDSKEQTSHLIDEIEKLVQRLQEKKAKMATFLTYYDKNKQKYLKLQNMIQEFRYQINDSSNDDQEEFEEAFKEIRNHFDFIQNNSRVPMKLNAEQSIEVIQTSLQQIFDEFSRNYLQVLEIREEDLKQLLQQQIQSQQPNSLSQNGHSNYNGNGSRNGAILNQKGISVNSNGQNQKTVSNQSNSSQSQKKITNNQSNLQQQIYNLYEPKEMLDYDELFSKNCIDIGFKVVPKYVEERKNIEKSSVEGNKKLGQDDSNQNILNSNNNSTSFSQNFALALKQQKMEAGQNNASPINAQQVDQEIKKEQQNENSMEIEKHNEYDKEGKQQKQSELFNIDINNTLNKNEKDDNDKQIQSLDEERGKRDSIQFFDVNMKSLSFSFQKNTNSCNVQQQQQQQQQQLSNQKLDKKILTRSASATNTNNINSNNNNTTQSQPTSLTTIPQQSTNISPDKSKQTQQIQKSEKEGDLQLNNSQKKIESSTNISLTNKQTVETTRPIPNPTKRFKLNEEDQDLSSKQMKSNNSSDDEYGDEDNEIQKSQSCPSQKKPKYIKKYDRKGQDFLKTLTEEQIDELIIDYNNLKNWREVEKKWGISKYHIIKYFKEQHYIITEDGEIESK